MSAHSSTYIVGHKNPDVDSICSAIAYAALKERRGETGFVAARCGNTNARIDAVLARFHQPPPHYVSDVAPRVRDVMSTEVIGIGVEATCAEALTLIDRHDVRILPVLTPDQKIAGTVSVFQLGHFFMPRINEPKAMRQVHTSLADISRALGARVLHAVNAERAEVLYVRIGAMDLASFWTLSRAEGIPPERSIIVVGNRRDIQLKSIELGARLLIITGGHPVDEDVIAQARARGTSVIISSYDTATTAWVTRTASRLDSLLERKFTALSPDTRLNEARRRIAASPAAAHMVLGDDGKLLGIFTKSDALKPSQTRLVLVDHNELTQAVPGADEVVIAEIIDHHRLAPIATQQPILFINEPVGSTCTIVADLYRRSGIAPTAELAGIMMAGLISDTLLLQSPTSTPKDADTLSWLESHTSVKARELADLIFSSGSVILSHPPAKVVRSDFKIYTEEGVRFAVSQVEELGFDNFQAHARDLSTALAALLKEEQLSFACLLVTDINTQNSLLLVRGEPDFVRRISYPHVEQDEIFDLPGVVSRKKQLIPYLTSLLRDSSAH